MTEEGALLQVARDWKAGELEPVHPQVGRLLNMALDKAGEDCVPIGRHTNSRAPNLAALIRGVHTRACHHGNRAVPDLICVLAPHCEDRCAGGVT
jgi:hypothetical protein